MKAKFFSFFLFCILFLIENKTIAQDDKKVEEEMRTYYMVFLKRGNSEIKDTTVRKQIQADHLANINKLAKEGKLVLAGPFLDNTELRGIFILDVDTKEEAERIVNTDPAVIAGRVIGVFVYTPEPLFP